MSMFYTVGQMKMKSNTNMTLYHKRFNPKKRLDEWDKYSIENVMWQGGKGASINKGYVQANDISIYIPYEQNKELEKVPFSIGDIVVKGISEVEITKQSDLKVDNFNITTLIDNNFGSDCMKHFYLGAK